MGVFQKSDERILGDGDFVESVLAESEEKMARQYALKAKGANLAHLQRSVSGLMNMSPEELVGPSKIRKVTKARILFCYWAVRELGFSMTDVSKQLKICLPTVSVAVQKGEKLVRDEGLVLEDHLNANI